MNEGVITTHTVRCAADGCALDVVATLDAGEVEPGMFVHIPLNRWLDATVRVVAVTREQSGRLGLVLDCLGEAAIVAALNFENETLWVSESGDR